MEITKDLLLSLWKRVEQYCIAKWDKEPEFIWIDSNGDINARFDISCCGNYEYEDEVINLSDLSVDLEVLANERLEKKRKQLEEIEKQRKINEKLEKERKIEKEKTELKRLISIYGKDII